MIILFDALMQNFKWSGMFHNEDYSLTPHKSLEDIESSESVYLSPDDGK